MPRVNNILNTARRRECENFWQYVPDDVICIICDGNGGGWFIRDKFTEEYLNMNGWNLLLIDKIKDEAVYDIKISGEQRIIFRK